MVIRDAHELIHASLDELKDFLAQGPHETEVLDYKRDLSGDISRTVAAMANSKGGTIIVGAEEDRRTKKPKRYDGFVSAAPLDQLSGLISTYLDPTPAVDPKIIESGTVVFLVVDALIERQCAAERNHGDRVTVLKLLREELAPIPEQMMRRQGRSHPPSPYDVLSDMQWRTLSSSGELRAIPDLQLRRTISKAYELINQESDLEKQWRDVMGNWGMAGRDVAANNFANQLKLLDTDTWRHVCEACKAIDKALLAEGAEPGSNAGSLVCL